MNISDTDISVYDSIQADQIEVGDQIIVDGDPIEVTYVSESEIDDTEIIVRGFSHESGDAANYSLPFDYDVDLWTI